MFKIKKIMKKIITIVILVATSFFFSRCNFGDFGDINVDPNNPSQPDTRFLYIGAVRQALPSFYINSAWNAWTLIFPQYVSEKTNVQFTKFETLTFGTSTYYAEAIRNLELIISLNTDEATKEASNVVSFGQSNDNQIALARTLRAYVYMHLTDVLGMIPYSEANKALEGNFTPAYDSQQSIYTDLNKELEEAYAQFDESNPLNESYEIIYGGNISKWKKMNASVRMQLAIKLFKADPNTGKTNFAKAYSQGFIRDNADILQYNYLNEAANQNPLYDNILVGARRDYWPSATIIDALKEYNDPRVSAYFTEARNGGYAGIPFGIDQSQAAAIDANTLSYWQDKFYMQNSPGVLITPSVMLLAAAEAAERGWITASAKDLYEEAIAAAFDQHDVDAADEYLAEPKVAYKTAGTTDERIAQIGIQKWFASFLQDGFETWADYRRLGVPELGVGSVSTISEIPRRRIYDSNDYDANKVNHANAVAEQGADLPTTRIWWDK
jgi:hypothetical protein